MLCENYVALRLINGTLSADACFCEEGREGDMPEIVITILGNWIDVSASKIPVNILVSPRPKETILNVQFEPDALLTTRMNNLMHKCNPSTYPCRRLTMYEQQKESAPTPKLLTEMAPFPFNIGSYMAAPTT